MDSNKFNFNEKIVNNDNNVNAQNSHKTADGNELLSSYDELNEAKERLRLLEMKIQALENRIAKKYPDVVFLNYKNRKRILVSLVVKNQANSTQKNPSIKFDFF